MPTGQKKKPASCSYCDNAVYEGPQVTVNGETIPINRRKPDKCKGCVHEHLQIFARKRALA
jgi:hypothetical protein